MFQERSAYRDEPLEEWFFKFEFRKDGHIIPAPSDAYRLYRNKRDVWLKNQHDTSVETHYVNLRPIEVKGVQGYLVVIGVKYPVRI